jgi:hypothetical protein
MKTSMPSMCAVAISMAALFSLLSVTPASATPIVSLVGPTTPVSVGSTFTIDVVGSELEDLYAFQLDFGFNPLALRALEVGEGPLLASAGTAVFFPGAPDNDLGEIGLTAGSLIGPGPGVSGSGVLARLLFEVIAADFHQTFVVANRILLLDSQFGERTHPGIFGAVSLSSEPSPPTPVPVPEPASLLLVLLGGTPSLLARTRGRWASSRPSGVTCSTRPVRSGAGDPHR